MKLSVVLSVPVVVGAGFLACAPAMPQAEAPPTPTAPPASPTPPAPPASAVASASVSASAPLPPEPPSAAPAGEPQADPVTSPELVTVAAPQVAKGHEGPPACPAGMLLVDGDYCTELQTRCLRSTYAPQNDKTICHEFERPSKCVGPKVHKRFCVDKFEYPNKKGARPLVMKNFPEAQHLCARQNKRVCTETEWTTACEGPEYKPYPYGYKRDPNVCRGDRQYRFPKSMTSGLLLTHSHDKNAAKAELERLWDALPSGSQPMCVSDYGVYDMPGNADELASSETPEPKSKFENVTTGGPWLEGVRNQCRPKIYTHNEGFSYYYLSFRCCAEADGKPTDPRSPKQIKHHEKWKP